MSGQGSLDQEEQQDNRIFNNRPPGIAEDFDIIDEEDKLDQVFFMPDQTDDKNNTVNKDKSR